MSNHPGYPAYERPADNGIDFRFKFREWGVKAFRSLSQYTPYSRFLHYRYTFLFSPIELSFLVNCVTETKDVAGDIVEIGCAAAATTCFLQRHMRCSGIEKPYYCIDTFSGFTREDVAFEIDQRSNRLGASARAFSVNSLKWFRRTLKLNNCDHVICVQTDVKRYSFRRPISFCLLDVDLYQPTLYALENVWPVLSSGGIIVIDDCCAPPAPRYLWDGAFQAYDEFTRAKGIPQRFAPYKLAVIQKP